MTKNLVFMRTHYFNKAVFSEFTKLSSSLDDSFDSILFIDNHTDFIKLNDDQNNIPLKINGIITKALIYNKSVHDKLNLPYYAEDYQNNDLGKVMWYCSDYPLYIVRKYFPDYDYYWSFENDVFCNGNSYKPFFENYKNDDSDLIISHYRSTKNENWVWNLYSTWCGYKDNDIYGCLFPVVRISAKAADFLYQKRLEHAEIFKNLINNTSHHKMLHNRWIFCEAFTATELTHNGFKCKNLDEPFLRYQPIYNLNIERIFEKPDFRLYHPVK